jgi:hypothetical protein
MNNKIIREQLDIIYKAQMDAFFNIFDYAGKYTFVRKDPLKEIAHTLTETIVNALTEINKIIDEDCK